MNVKFDVTTCHLTWNVARVLLIFVLLSGCATTPEMVGPESATYWQTRQLTLNAIQNWEFTGRIAIQREEEGWFAGLRWQQHDSVYHIQVSGPAGQGAARLKGDDAGVTLTKSDQTVYHAIRPEDLLLIHLGWQVPVRGLRYWMRGLPSPTQWDSLVFDVSGRLVRLQQDGWDIHFDHYSIMENSVELPGRLVLERPPLMVRIVVEHWG